jgi:hypothetical protein
MLFVAMHVMFMLLLLIMSATSVLLSHQLCLRLHISAVGLWSCEGFSVNCYQLCCLRCQV